MSVNSKYKQYWRIRQEASFDAATPGGGEEWNVTGTYAQGWQDLPVGRENDGLQPKTAKIFPSVASGERGMNVTPPLSGAEVGELGSLEMPVYGDMMGNIFRTIFGGVDVKENAGTAALAAGAWGWSGQAITAPTGDEVLKFTFVSGTAASAVITILEGGSSVETISIPDGTFVGDVYSKGGYGAGGTVTLTTSGTFDANITVAGVQYFQPAYWFGSSSLSCIIEEFGRPEAHLTTSTYSDYYPGCIIPSATFAFDREAADGLLTATINVLGVNPTGAAQTGYSEDVEDAYAKLVFAGWTATFLVGDAAWGQIKSMSLDINSNNELYSVASGDQSASGMVLGDSEGIGTFTLYPIQETTNRWSDYEAETARDIKILFTSPEAVNQTTYFEIQFHFPAAYIEDYSRNRNNSVLGAEIILRGVSSVAATTPEGTSVDTPLIVTRKGRCPV